jgi:hypothetical protein
VKHDLSHENEKGDRQECKAAYRIIDAEGKVPKAEAPTPENVRTNDVDREECYSDREAKQ